MVLKESRILVTGAGGFIGSHLVERLVRDGHQVRAMVEYDSLGSWGWLDSCTEDVQSGLEVVMGDVRDRNFVHKAVLGREVVLHLAALISIPYSYDAPYAYVETNLIGTMNVLEAAREHGVARVVHTSTSEVYGSAQCVPIDETHPLNAQSPYAATKVAADQMALAYHRSFGVPVSILRPFNTFGPRQSTRAVIPTIITQVLSGDGAIRLGNVDARRDFTYVEDTAGGFIAAAAASACVGEVTNIGGGFDISIREVVELVGELSDREVVIEHDERRARPDASEVDRLFAGIDKARRVLDWPPAGSGGLDGFRSGLEKTLRWFSEPGNLRHYPRGKFYR